MNAETETARRLAALPESVRDSERVRGTITRQVDDEIRDRAEARYHLERASRLLWFAWERWDYRTATVREKARKLHESIRNLTMNDAEYASYAAFRRYHRNVVSLGSKAADLHERAKALYAEWEAALPAK